MQTLPEEDHLRRINSLPFHSSPCLKNCNHGRGTTGKRFCDQGSLGNIGLDKINLAPSEGTFRAFRSLTVKLIHDSL